MSKTEAEGALQKMDTCFFEAAYFPSRMMLLFLPKICSSRKSNRTAAASVNLA